MHRYILTMVYDIENWYDTLYRQIGITRSLALGLSYHPRARDKHPGTLYVTLGTYIACTMYVTCDCALIC